MHLFNPIAHKPTERREGFSHSKMHATNDEREGFPHSHYALNKIEGREGFSHSHANNARREGFSHSNNTQKRREGFPHSKNKQRREGFSHSDTETTDTDSSCDTETSTRTHAESTTTQCSTKNNTRIVTTKIKYSKQLGQTTLGITPDDNNTTTSSASDLETSIKQRQNERCTRRRRKRKRQRRRRPTCDKRQKEATPSAFNIPAEKPPMYNILRATDEDSRARWLVKLIEYRRAEECYRQTYNVKYHVPIRALVAPSIWNIISTDILRIEDATDPCSGEAPNDSAIKDCLLKRGKYKPTNSEKPGQVHHESVARHYNGIKWPSNKGLTHTACLDVYLTEWDQLTKTVARVDMPTQKDLVKYMLKAIQPDVLRKAVTNRMKLGRSPTPFTRNNVPWRKRARKNIQLFRRLVREHTQYLDLEIRIKKKNANTQYHRYYNKWGFDLKTTAAATTTCDNSDSPVDHDQVSDTDTSYADDRKARGKSAVTNKSVDDNQGSTRPICIIEGCDNLVKNKRRGAGYYVTCKKHAHAAPDGKRH